MAYTLFSPTRAFSFRQSTARLRLFPAARSVSFGAARARLIGGFRVRASSDGKSYLDMWKNAVERQNKSVDFKSIAGRVVEGDGGGGGGEVDVSKKNEDFQRILEVSKEERDRIQRMQVIDRAAAAIAAARALIKEKRPLEAEGGENSGGYGGLQTEDEKPLEQSKNEGRREIIITESSRTGVPGPDFWSWAPPPESDSDTSPNDPDLLEAKKPSTSPNVSVPVAVKEKSLNVLSIPFESKLSQSGSKPRLPPLQSLMEVKEEEVPVSHSLKEEEAELDSVFSEHSVEIAHVLEAELDEEASSGVDAEGLRWWKETGIERRPDGVICRWTMIRGVKADQDVEWQEKYWEASDVFGYKELGSEKSGRDATGNVWREFWRESMWQDAGLVHLEKTADKWGKNGNGDEWQEQWWEHYDASNKAEKWAHKWCSIDPTTPLDAGHAHVWHERWGETYDGHGGSVKYTDKWAERCEGDGWTKWGDKWDEHFDPNGHGVKQGETWWEGKHFGERWNRTWGERHNGSGWVHKYGKSSCGEHWDTHEPQETWYERFPHFGFYHCFENSQHLRQVPSPAEIDIQELQVPSPVEIDIQEPQVLSPAEIDIQEP